MIGEKLLSVIIPISSIKSRESRLIETLKQINILDEKNRIEIIVVIDKKNVDEEFEIRQLLETYLLKTVNILVGEFGAPGLARNAGLRKCSGIWTAFWDCDDIVDVKNFLSMVIKAQNGAYQIAIGSYERISETDQSKSYNSFVGESVKSNLEQVALNPGIWRFAFKREIIDNLEFPPWRMAEDQYFLMSLRITKKKILIYNRTVYKYFFGGLGHLTTEPSALNELKHSARMSLTLLESNIHEFTIFEGTIFVKQCLSGIFYSRGFNRYRCLFILLNSCLYPPMKLRLIILQSIFLVIRKTRYCN